MSKLICIDAGHGMVTSGKYSCKMDEDLYINGKLVRKKGERIKENEWNRGVSTYLNDALKRCGFRTMYVADMTGKTDTSLQTRVSRANNANADLYISCHYNAIGNCSSWQTKCTGLLVLVHNGCSSTSKSVANKINKHLVADVKYKHSYGVGVDTQWSGFSLYVLKNTKMPAVLIEYGFMDYKPETLKMLDPAYQKLCGEATCKAVCEQYGVTYVADNAAKPQPSEPTPAPAPNPQPSTPAKGVTEIKALQTALNASYRSGLSVDGSYGPKTKAAVKAHPLKSGKKSKHVKWLQQMLVKLGYSVGSSGADGSYGPATKSAVTKFQRAKGLSADGCAGPATHNKIVECLKK